MAKTGDDCYFFYYQTCIKGTACPFRHVEEARKNEVTCDDWRRQQCHTVPCPYRHMELQKNTPCYYETQPGGCTKPSCPFQHKFSVGKPRGIPASTPSTIVTPGSVPPTLPTQAVPPHPVISGAVRGAWNPVPPVWPGPHIPPPLSTSSQVYPRGPPPPVIGSGYTPFPPPAVPVSRPPFFPPSIEPVIINPNEESSDQDSIKGSPVKSARTVVPSSASLKSDNPLDYFLNAKPWVDPKERNSQSPDRTSPHRRQGSVSPRRSLSPDNVVRRRSVSAERYGGHSRRRSSSLDRSRSPEWRDRRRFGRRSSRSPRRRSRSPERDGRGFRERGLMNKFKLAPPTGPKLAEVKVTGSKIISIKKDDGNKEKSTEETTEEKTKTKEPESTVMKDEVKSLEEIYRERALMSLMEAKRKKIQENKRKRWEKTDAGLSESDKSDGQSTVNEKGDNPEQSTEPSSDDEAKSEIDLSEDIDIELGEGELEDADNDKQEQTDATKVRTEKAHRKPVSVSSSPKPSIKSRLGMKAINDIKRQTDVKTFDRNVKRSVKDRLGIKSSTEPDNTVRSGVIKLNRASKAEDVLSRIRQNRKVGENKSILMLPQITIKNELDIEQRKAGIKQRLGLLEDDTKRDKKKKKSLDEELMKLLNDEGADIAEDDLDLLSKKEKKKLLKKLLAQQGREDDYEAFKRKKKKGGRRKKDHIEEEEEELGDGDTRRKIKIRDRLEEKEQSDEWDEDELPSEEDICLGEEVEGAVQEEVKEDPAVTVTTETVIQPTPVVTEVRSAEEIAHEKAEKEARLREALEPKSLDDIRKERAVKRAQGGDASSRLGVGGHKRKIVIESEPVKRPSPDPPVRVTFNSDVFPSGRKLSRLGRLGEQNENDQPAKSGGIRTLKHERRIYVPPTKKKLGESGTLSVPGKRASPPKGRDIVDYGDLFSKKSTSAEAVTDRKKSVKLTVSASESDLSRRLKINKPQKVEVKNAEVKTFAEIMAEKKRKRQLAQQGKPYTPVVFDDTDSKQPVEKKTAIFDRLSQDDSSNDARKSPSKSIPVTQSSLTLKKTSSEANIDPSGNKPTRWKRRKLSSDNISSSSEQFTSKSQENINIKESPPFAQINTAPVSKPVRTSEDVKPSEKSSVSFGTQQVKDTSSEKSTKDKKKPADSLLEFDDDLLDMDDEDLDLDLGDEQDHDALMREMDELLS